MAWKSPEDNKHKNQDEDEITRILTKIEDAFNNILNKNKSGSGKDNNSSFNILPYALVALVLFVALIAKGVYTVNEQEQAVILRLGKYYTTTGPGLNFHIPVIDTKYQHNVTRERSYVQNGESNKIKMLTKDENILEVPLTVQYKISNIRDFVLNVSDPEVSLKHATDSAIRHVAGSTEMYKALTEGREAMSAEVHQRLQKLMDDYGAGINIVAVNLQSIAPPAEVINAFDDVIAAREEEQKSRNDAQRYVNERLPEARGKARQLIEEASAYRDELVARAEGETSRFNSLLTEYQKAPEVTRKRLYLETMQQVISNTTKIIMPQNPGNTMLYLPIDKIMESNRSNAVNANKQSNITSGYAQQNYNNSANNNNYSEAHANDRNILQNQRNNRSREMR